MLQNKLAHGLRTWETLVGQTIQFLKSIEIELVGIEKKIQYQGDVEIMPFFYVTSKMFLTSLGYEAY